MPKSPKFNEVSCPKCKEPMAAAAEICPNCQTEWPAEVVARRIKDLKAKKQGCTVALILAPVLLLMLIILIPNDENPSTTPSVESSEPSSEAAKPDVPTEAQKAAASDFYRSIFANLKGCDAAATETVAVIGRIQSGSASMYDGYNAATNQVEACETGAGQLRELEVPAVLSEKAREAAGKAKIACSNAALAKKLAAETAQEVFDGDLKPSKLAKFKERAEDAQSGIMVCAASALGVAMTSGWEGGDLPKLD